MLQRIQTIWMLLAGIAVAALFFVKNDASLTGINFVIGLLTGGIFANILNYRKRSRQITVNTVLIVINALLVGFLAYWLLNLSGGIDFPEKGIELIFPIIAMVCLYLANVYIRKDERLVKSVDRLR